MAYQYPTSAMIVQNSWISGIIFGHTMAYINIMYRFCSPLTCHFNTVITIIMYVRMSYAHIASASYPNAIHLIPGSFHSINLYKPRINHLYACPRIALFTPRTFHHYILYMNILTGIYYNGRTMGRINM